MLAQIRSIADIYRFNTMTLRAVSRDLSDEQTGRRWRQGEGSSIAFLLGHLLASRYSVLQRLGAADENPHAELFGNFASARDLADYPPFAELVAEWDTVAERLEVALAQLDDATLEAPASGYPVADQTTRGALMFMAWHESYHIGQIGLMRTEMSLPSVRAVLSAARPST
ncbi:MAG: DinB family protein [Acidobacteriota bacterium]